MKKQTSPLIPLCPFIRLPTEGDTKPRGLSDRTDSLFSGTATGSTVSTVSAHTVSTILSMLADLGKPLFIVSRLKRIVIVNSQSNVIILFAPMI